MTKQLATWKWISENVQLNIPVMLLYVLESWGSSPGRAGFFMAVNARGEITGSIGGGIMEHKFVEAAKAKLHLTTFESSVHKQNHNKSAVSHQSGMICSGEQTIFLYRIQQKDLEEIQKLENSLKCNIPATLRLLPEGITYDEKIPEAAHTFSMQTEAQWEYRERIGARNYLYIVGGGHCSLAFSAIMSTLGFGICVFDTREGLNTFVNNYYADEKRVLADYTHVGELVPAGDQAYVIVMTFGYRTDYVTLKSLLGKRFRYIGVLGSQKKIDKMFADLANEGFLPEQLSAIHAPAGIPIKSETPEEIAISIAAEIIKIKNENREAL